MLTNNPLPVNIFLYLKKPNFDSCDSRNLDSIFSRATAQKTKSFRKDRVIWRKCNISTIQIICVVIYISPCLLVFWNPMEWKILDGDNIMLTDQWKLEVSAATRRKCTCKRIIYNENVSRWKLALNKLRLWSHMRKTLSTKMWASVDYITRFLNRIPGFCYHFSSFWTSVMKRHV